MNRMREPRYKLAIDQDLAPDANPRLLQPMPMVAFAEATRDRSPPLSPERAVLGTRGEQACSPRKAGAPNPHPLNSPCPPPRSRREGPSYHL